MNRQVIDTLRDIRRGDLLSEIDEAMGEVIQACQDTGKMGTLTLNLKIKPNPKMGVMIVEDVLRSSPPQEVCETMFHVTDDLTLSLRDPRQPDIPDLEPVSNKKIVSVSEEKKEVSHG